MGIFKKKENKLTTSSIDKLWKRRYLGTTCNVSFLLTPLKTQKQNAASPGGLEPPTFRLTAVRAHRLRHGDLYKGDVYKTWGKDCFLEVEKKKTRKFYQS